MGIVDPETGHPAARGNGNRQGGRTGKRFNQVGDIYGEMLQDRRCDLPLASLIRDRLRDTQENLSSARFFVGKHRLFNAQLFRVLIFFIPGHLNGF